MVPFHTGTKQFRYGTVLTLANHNPVPYHTGLKFRYRCRDELNTVPYRTMPTPTHKWPNHKGKRRLRAPYLSEFKLEKLLCHLLHLLCPMSFFSSKFNLPLPFMLFFSADHVFILLNWSYQVALFPNSFLYLLHIIVRTLSKCNWAIKTYLIMVEIINAWTKKMKRN